jgi:hypothetical protein
MWAAIYYGVHKIKTILPKYEEYLHDKSWHGG